MWSSPHASESGHWYARDGSPVYQVPAKSGSMRPATLADARKMGLVPGVSGVQSCAAKAGLERWKVQQGILSALTLPRLPNELDADFVTRAVRDSQEQARKAAERGSAIHAAIQGHYEGKPPDEEHWPFVLATVKAVNETYGEGLAWWPEMSFASPAGYGGKCDLNTAGIVLDFKTKEFTQKDLDDGKQLAWDDHAIQLSAYREGLGMPEARCANVFVSTNQPGLVVISSWTEIELKRGWEMFKALLAYWQASRKFNSAFELKAAA